MICVSIRKADAVRCDGINVRCRDVFAAVETYVSITKVVGPKDNYIGSLSGK